MRLGVISDCIHYKTPDGKIGTENHILLRQFNELCSRFSSAMICCPFGVYDSSKVLSFYNNAGVNFTAMPLVGGDSFSDKLKMLAVLPKWLRGYKKIDRFSDIVYQRFPNNINIPGFYYFYLKRKKVFATYTGTWSDYSGEPFFYRLQRRLLKKYFRGPVWVYASQQINDGRIRNGISPSYSEKEWNEEIEQVTTRIQKIQNEGLEKFRLVTVGTLIYYKNQLGILKACVELKKRHFPFSLKVVGDGPMFSELQTFIKQNDLQQEVELVGKKNTAELRDLYRHSDFVVQAPRFEGFGKVPIEGFFHGAIPVLNNIGLASSMTGDEERGFLFDASDPANLVDTFFKIKEKITSLPAIIEQGRRFAKEQTLERWANEYYATVSEFYKIS